MFIPHPNKFLSLVLPHTGDDDDDLAKHVYTPYGFSFPSPSHTLLSMESVISQLPHPYNSGRKPVPREEISSITLLLRPNG